MQVYDQIYNNFDPNKAGVGSAPNATNYTSPILHSAQIANLKGNTRCACFSCGWHPTTMTAACELLCMRQHGSPGCRATACCLQVLLPGGRRSHLQPDLQFHRGPAQRWPGLHVSY